MMISFYVLCPKWEDCKLQIVSRHATTNAWPWQSWPAVHHRRPNSELVKWRWIMLFAVLSLAKERTNRNKLLHVQTDRKGTLTTRVGFVRCEALAKPWWSADNVNFLPRCCGSFIGQLYFCKKRKAKGTGKWKRWRHICLIIGVGGLPGVRCDESRNVRSIRSRGLKRLDAKNYACWLRLLASARCDRSPKM